MRDRAGPKGSGVDFLANYTGARCPVCNKRFVDNDDIVVCPVCGAPHHRECYSRLGHCALAELHIDGHTWQPPEREENAQEPDAAVCPACGAKNPATGIFCQKCGAPLSRQSAPDFGGQAPFGQTPFGAQAPFGRPGGPQANPYTSAFGGLDPAEEIEGVSARDIALYVGENSQYFLPRFKQIAGRSGFTINFCALFFNFFYFFYRKMYGIGAILLGLLAASQIPTLFVLPETIRFVLSHMEDILNGFNVFNLFAPTEHLWAYSAMYYMRFVLLAAGIVFACFANRLYMRHVLKNVRKIHARYEQSPGGFNDNRYTQALAHYGRTNRAIVVIAAVGCVVVYFGVYMVMMMAMMQ